jgi:type I restriction enzyme, S subunit
MTVARSKLGDQATIIMGQSPPGESYNKDHTGVPLLNGPTEFGPFYPIEKQWTTIPTKLCEAGDVLFCVRGATAGRLNVADKTYCLGRGLAAIRGTPGKLDPSFLRHVLRNGYAKFQARGVGSTFINISNEELSNFDVPVLPLPEQQRIAGVLDGAESLQGKRRAALSQLDALTQSFFIDLFGDPLKNPKGWRRVPFGELLTKIDSGWSPTCLDRPVIGDEWGVLKLGAVTSCEYDPSENKALPPNVAPIPEIEVQPGDLLFTRKNTYELVAACALVHQTPPRLLMSDLIFRFRLRRDAGVNTSFLQQLLIYPTKRRDIQKLAGGSAGSMPNISKERLQTAMIEVPPISLQLEFARRVATVEKLKTAHRSSLTELDAFFATLRSHAFRGEL